MSDDRNANAEEQGIAVVGGSELISIKCVLAWPRIDLAGSHEYVQSMFVQRPLGLYAFHWPQYDEHREAHMKRRRLVVALACALVATPIGLAVAGGKGPAVIKINSNKKGKAVANFKHHEHQKRTACKTCHHKDAAKPKKCVTCHTQVKERDPKTGAPGFKDAFHGRCHGCHKKKKDKPELMKCETCHGK